MGRTPTIETRGPAPRAAGVAAHSAMDPAINSANGRHAVPTMDPPGSAFLIWQVVPAMQAIAQPLLIRLEAALGGADGSAVSAGEVANALEQLYAEICAEMYAAGTWSRLLMERRARPVTRGPLALYGRCALLRGVSPSAPSAADADLQDAAHPCVQMLQQLWDVLVLVFARCRLLWCPLLLCAHEAVHLG